MRAVGVVCVAALVGGCLDRQVSSDSAGEGTTGGTCLVAGDESAGFRCSPISLPINRDIDILFVVDNSGTMGAEQAALARAMGTLIERFEAHEPATSYRIAVTTTDNGNPWCASTTPEAGALQATSCRTRLSEFQFPAGMTVETWACTDVCSHDSVEVPTPWIERGWGMTNLPDGVDAVEAAQCFVPQGIAGCGFESPLESMAQALARSDDPSDAAFGFVRSGSVLVVVFVTDELDCSHVPSKEDIFLPEGDRVFWSDPDLEYPTSAVCWNAGVRCSGGPGTYDECHAESHDRNGNHDAPYYSAVLVPLLEYVGVLDSLATTQDVVVAGIVGVPPGYDDGGELVYSDATDPQFQTDFGIGPGCQAQDELGNVIEQALPPVRIRELAERYEVGGERLLFSVCDADYSPALGRIADAALAHIHPSCYSACVADVDPDALGLQIDCSLSEQTPTPDGVQTRDLPPCQVLDGRQALPPGEPSCFYARTGADMHAECRDEGWNLEFVILRPGPPPPGVTVLPTCELSQNRDVDCPDLP